MRRTPLPRPPSGVPGGGPGDIEVTLLPEELEGLDEAAVKALYEEKAAEMRVGHAVAAWWRVWIVVVHVMGGRVGACACESGRRIARAGSHMAAARFSTPARVDRRRRLLPPV